MKKFTKATLLAAVAAMALPVLAADPVTEKPAGYTLRWSDEFDGTALNEAIWNIEVNGNGGGNQELQYYRRENVAVGKDPKTGENALIITARRENYQGRSFTSGRITTQDKAAFKHGIIQARVKFPKTTDGLWPAYWMMGNDMRRVGWPRCGEMDIVELGHFNGINAGTQDRYFGGTLHYGTDASNEHHQQLSQEYTAPEDNPICNDEYHIITVEWDNDNLYMYYDLEGYKAAQKRRARYFSTSVKSSTESNSPGTYFQKPFFFLLNLAVGGWYPGILDPDKITALPNAGDEARMYVDWVRVYQADDDADAQHIYYDADGNKVTNIPEEPEPERPDDNKTELSSFATPALEDGESTFDFADAEDVVLISTSQGVTGNFLSLGTVKADYNVDEVNNFLYIWEDTYVPDGTSDRVNSFGWEESYNRYAVTTKGWSGLGFASTGKGKDLSMIDDSYWLHFAMKGYDVDAHTSHNVIVGDAQFRIGTSDGKYVSLGDFPRDGNWYYFDIPVKILKEMSSDLFEGKNSDYLGNVVAFLSGGVEGSELSFDNIFFYKSKSREIPSFTDKSADLGPYGYKSLDDDGKPVFDFKNARNVTPLYLSGDMWEHLTAGGTYDNSIVKREHDNSEQAGKNNFFVWEGTFSGKQVREVPNSFGNVPYDGFPSWAHTIGQGWNGAGWASVAGQGMTPAPKDLSHITDDYVLHFSVRSEQAVAHAPFQIKLGAEGTDAYITLGSYSQSPIFADFNRDGEWYSFDIPLKALKMYGTPWTKGNGNLSAYTDYVLTFNTAGTKYSGCYFAIDNVFLYEPVDAPDPDEFPALGKYTTKSLDADGKSTFDFSGKVFWPVTAGAAERAAMGQENIIADLSINDQNTHLYPWEGTYAAADSEGLNSFGNPQGWMSWVTTGMGWSGMGLANDEVWEIGEIGMDGRLHFAVKGTQPDVDLHLILGRAHFTIGSKPFINNNEPYPVLGDFVRDGEWYSYDIPLSEFYKINSDVFAGNQGNFTGNLMCFSNGGEKGNKLDIDNIFFWQDKESYDASGIDGIEADENPAGETVLGIYTVSGIAVRDMSRPGIYIVRTDRGARKVIVR